MNQHDGQHKCVSTYSRWAVDNIFQAHSELAVVVTVEVKEGEVSLRKVEMF